MTAKKSAIEEEAAVQGAVPLLPTHMRWAFPNDVPYSYIEFPADIDLAWAQERYSEALEAYRVVRDAVQVLAQAPPQQPQENSQTADRPNRDQHPQRQQGGGQSNYPPNQLMSTVNDDVNWTCDKCGGHGEGIARRQQKGRMPGDAIVCLNPSCKEGDFRYTITMVQPGTSNELSR